MGWVWQLWLSKTIIVREVSTERCKHLATVKTIRDDAAFR